MVSQVSGVGAFPGRGPPPGPGGKAGGCMLGAVSWFGYFFQTQICQGLAGGQALRELQFTPLPKGERALGRGLTGLLPQMACVPDSVGVWGWAAPLTLSQAPALSHHLPALGSRKPQTSSNGSAQIP